MTIEATIAELVDKYKRETNKSQSEADVRAGYIDLLFAALGWNIYNDPGGLTRYKREGYIRGAGIADVGLEIAGKPALMLEAKKFGSLAGSKERVGDRTLEEKQLFRYARGKKIPYCILTNFERLQVFNADHERLILWFDQPEELLSRVPELMHLTPEKVLAGSLPASERQLEIKPIDQEFLSLLQDWRLRLANIIYQRNSDKPALKDGDSFDFGKLMAAVQRLLDRLILIRYADDKEVLLVYDVIENILSDYHKRGAYTSADYLVREFNEFSHIMDEHHNTTLFKPGHICEQVFIPNDTLEKIMAEINNISFRKFTSDILGNTYETYLGTKLVLKNGFITSQERTDIRKAGGIYYTPSFIVHYMVDNTLGHLLSDLEKKDGINSINKVKEIRILDPACGSGSFLIYAYHVLADYYRRMNEIIEAERIKLLAGGAGKDMFKRMEIFKQLAEPLIDYPHHILEKQLYGVDLDPEAAEIAAVNLTMQAFADTKQEKLPLILNENIKVGNSLVSGTEEELRHYFGDAWQSQKPFNWEQEFPEIMAGGGFDIVIGNPPYVRQEQLKELKPLLQKQYECYTGAADIYVYFYERGFQKLKEGGLLSFISPNKYFRSGYGEKLRQLLGTKTTISHLIDFGDAPVFNAITYPSIIVFRKSNPEGSQTRVFTWKPGRALEEFSSAFDSNSFLVNQKEFTSDGWKLESPAALHLLEKLREAGKPLGEYVNGRFYYGIKTGLNKAFVVDRETRDRLIAEHPSSEEVFKPFLRGRDIKRWHINFAEQYLIKIESSENKDHPWSGKSAQEAEEIFSSTYPSIFNWFKSYQKELIKRDDQGKYYWELRSCKYWGEFENPKIIWGNLARKPQFTFVEDGFYLSAPANIIISSEKYLLGILNSKITRYMVSQGAAQRQGGFYEFKPMYIAPLAIPEKPEIEHISVLADQILAITKDENYFTVSAKRNRVDDLERQIDQLVYRLYGLTSGEIAIVEGQTNL